MVKYTVNKPIKFRGKRYIIGDVIGDDVVEPSRAMPLIKSGYLSEAFDNFQIKNEAAEPSQEISDTIIIPIISEECPLSLELSRENTAELLRIMQLDVKEAEKEITRIEDDNMLIVLNACDSRKGVKNSSRKRALELQNGNDGQQTFYMQEEPESNNEEVPEKETSEEPEKTEISQEVASKGESGEESEKSPEGNEGDSEKEDLNQTGADDSESNPEGESGE